MKLLKNEWLQLLILAAPFCAVALLWDKLPAQIPIHWNARGEIDNYSGKAFGTLFMPALNLFLAALLAGLPRIDPKFKNSDAEARISVGRTFKIIRLVITGFNACVALAILAFSLHYHFDMNRFIFIAMSLLFIVLGNVMNKLRPNYFAGIRTPWTLESRTVWLKTHRLGGIIMVLGGIGMLLITFLLPKEQLVWLGILPFSIAIFVVPVVYSYFCYRAEKKNSETAH
jgi:uncharacterized membrane protein